MTGDWDCVGVSDAGPVDSVHIFSLPIHTDMILSIYQNSVCFSVVIVTVDFM